jgi:hypothetical protein
MIAFQPTNVVLQTGNGQNLVSWPLVVGAASYSVQRSTNGVTFTTVGTPSTPYYLDTAVAVGTTYYYQIAAVNVSGTSSYSVSYPISIVPCLPGQVNLGFIRYMSQLRSDKLNSNYLTLDEWNANINQVAYELYDILVSKFGDQYFLAPILQFNLTGAISYPIPDGAQYAAAPALYKLVGVDVNVNSPGTQGPNQGWVPVARANLSDRDRWTVWPGVPAALNNAYALSYDVIGNQIYFYPANTAQTVRLLYVPMMVQMLQDNDMLAFSISGWSEYVIVRSAMLAMSKEESSEKYGILQSQLEMQISRIETQAANRDVGQPRTVSNTRATMGDPGFGWGGGFGGMGQGWGY